MELSPGLYHFFVRPRWFSGLCVKPIIQGQFDFINKEVLDFGSGIGTSSPLFHPDRYLGVDRDIRRVHYAKRLHPEYHFDIIHGHHIPAPDNTFDYVLIVSVLHHIPSEELPGYMHEFRRVLKPQGKVIAIEPCFFEHSSFNNRFMNFFDKGQYIRKASEYLNIFENCHYETKIHDRYKQLFFYNKLFFTATPK